MANKDWTGNSNSIWKTLGASNHTDKEREPNEFYATEPRALGLFAPLFPIHHKVYECACGNGSLSKWLVGHGHDVLSSDIIDRGYGHTGIDFLKVGTTDLFAKDYFMDTLVEWYAKGNPNLSEPFDILTNPPFAKAEDFIRHALDLIPEDGRVIMFLKTIFLEGKERKRLIYDVNPPRWVYQFSGRILCAKNGDFKEMQDGGGSAVAYQFQVYNKHNDEHKTEIKWI